MCTQSDTQVTRAKFETFSPKDVENWLKTETKLKPEEIDLFVKDDIDGYTLLQLE